MALPFTVEQFYGVFRDHNAAVWPAQWFLVALSLVAVGAMLRPQPWSGVVVSAILGVLWARIALTYHIAFFARISPAADGFAAVSAAGAVVFIWQGVIRRKLAYRWVPGLKAKAGVVFIVFALVMYPIWSAYAGHPYPSTFGVSRPTTIFTIGLLCFAVQPMLRSPLIVPWLWCLVGAQAAFLLDVQPDLGLIAAAVVGMGLIATAGQHHRALKP